MVIDDIFFSAVAKKASDIHLVAGHPPMLRIDGNLSALTGATVLAAKEVEVLALSLLDRVTKERFLNERELDISYALADHARFRVNLHFEKGNMGLVARVIQNAIPTMEDVAMQPVVYELARLHQGLVIVTGPTGCGKSTSQAAMIDLINTERTAHIVTLEDPIEFLHVSKKSIIKQREYGIDFLSFAEALKHVVRQDPNVIMVGEMRDLETVGATITLAEMGHLVLATLHTGTAAQTIDRIIDIFPPHQQNQVRLQLSLSLQGIIAQRLVPKKEGGRMAVREILLNTPATANLIRENKVQQLKTVIQTSAKDGMQSLQQDLRELVKQGLVAEETIDVYTKAGVI